MGKFMSNLAVWPPNCNTDIPHPDGASVADPYLNYPYRIEVSMMKITVWRRIAVAAAFFVAFHTAQAADVNARIKGTVTDPTGAVVPNAQVVATNIATGVKFNTTSQGDGGYLFPQLPIGTYSISVSFSGFKAFTATGIVLSIDQVYVEPVHLAVGNASEKVEVQADSVQVDTTGMQFSNVVDAHQMEELPLIGRNFTSLETTLPGVQPTDTRFTGTYSVSGAQAQQSEYLINGADTNDIALNDIVFIPNLDAIDEFNLIDGPLNAEYDRNSGGIVSATIKQGTNSFHGDVFEFYRDTFLNTQNFLQKTFSSGALTSTVSPYHQNIFGGTLGGPVLRNKLHFFGAYQGTRESIPQAVSPVQVFSPAMLTGNFQPDVAGTGPNGATTFSTNPIPASITIPGCAAGTTWASCLTKLGGVVPASSLSSTAVAIAKKYVPAANSGTYGYGFNATTQETVDQYIGRVDYSLGPKNQIAVLGLYEKLVDSNTLPFSGGNVPGFGDGNIEHIQQWTFDYVRQLSSSAVNDFAAHYTRFNFDADVPQQVVQPSSVGFSITPEDSAHATIPLMQVAGYFTLGGNTSGPQPRIDQVIQANDTFSKVIGGHSLKFGYDGRRFNVSNVFDSSNSGQYQYQGGGTYSTGDPGLDFLLGIPDSYLQTPNGVIQPDAFLNYMFVQDSWKVTNALTFNYGLGYSIDTPLRNHQYGGEAVSCFIVGQQSVVFPSAPKNMVFPGDHGCTDSAQAFTHYNEFGPRIGFAWAPDLGVISGSPGKLSVRGGFGMYYNRTESESSLQTLNMPPFGFTSGGAADFGGSPEFVNPFADINNGKTSGAGGAAGPASEPNRFPYTFPVKGQSPSFPSTIFNISSFDSTFRAPYAENFQLSVEREFPSKTIVRVSYVGSLGRREQISPEGNYETAAGHAACVANPACVAARNTQALSFPQNTIGGSPVIAEEGEVSSEGASNYNSAQVSITKAPTHGLLFQLSYTFSHAMDNGSSFENSGFGGFGLPGATRGYNQYVKSLNYGDSAYDTRQNLVFSPVYITPILGGQSALSPLNLALSGWQISGIMQVATGEPYDIAYYFGSAHSLYCSVFLSFYNCPDIPNQTAPLVRQNPRARNSLSGNSPYFSPASFAAEPIGSFGNIHRNPYHGPGVNNTNAILAKNFNLSADGRLRLQLRLESDNVFNHTQFNLPDGTISDGTFGSITSAKAARQTQLGGKLYF
jgi:hypothetical protein